VRKHCLSSFQKRRTTEHLSDIVTLLTKIAFLLFSIYSLLVCPKDVAMESPVCRGLDHYRRSIVDPYILPPLRAAASHPAIAPRIELARPYVDHAIDLVKTRYHIVHDKVVVATEPYVIFARKQYNTKARPQVRLMQYNMRRYQRQAQPYVDLAKAKALRAWYQAEVYVRPILLKLEQMPMLLKTFIAKPLEEGKERWVDPQLKKIVDKVHEMSASAAVVAEEKNVPDGTSATTEKATFYSSPSIAATVSITEATSRAIEEAPAPTVPEPVPEESTQIKIVEALPTLSTLTSGAVTSDSALETATTDPLDAPLTNPNYDEEVEDIEFFEDLEKWVAEALVVEQATTPIEMPAKPTALTEEEKAEMKRILTEETELKRKAIMARHDKWEEGLEALITLKYNDLKDFLEKSRQQAFSDLSSLAQSQLGVLNSQLETAIQGTKKTLEKLQAGWDGKHGEMDEDIANKLPRWTQILDKVESSFARKSEKLNEDLGSWVAAWVERESEVLREAADEVKAFADKAQNDLIADYSWLDDVTHRDWERYHKLMFRELSSVMIWRALLTYHLGNREATEEFQKLFNGHSSPPLSNLVQDEIARVEDQMHKIAMNFKTDINGIRKEGWKYIMGETDENAKPEQVPKPAETAAEEPSFSILPIDLEGEIDNIIQGGEVILSKSKEQIEQAVLMAEEAATEAGKRAKEAVVGHDEL
jgi:hypothetical protein